jgi:KipI family sensor histidine kinase inhibitor
VIRPFGEAALLVELGGTEPVHALAEAIRQAPPEGVIESVPGIDALLVEFDPLKVDAGTVSRELERVLTSEAERGRAGGRLRSIPVLYGGQWGPDLEEVASLTGLTADEVVRRHRGSVLMVELVGFAPGFAYMGPLPPELHVPRLAEPRSRTPAGSVAVARRWTGIYPTELPGGWRVIGRTPITLFDPHRDPPAYLAPGDTVVIEEISSNEWDTRSGVPSDW